MEILKFTLSGKQAMFKKPDVNTYYYFTYGQIHKPALLGIFGAILGYAGYNRMKAQGQKTKDGRMFPEFYERLQGLKISVVPNAPKGYFSKRVTYFNNSVGYASNEQGHNLIVKEQWLEDPSWDVYVLIDVEEAEKLAKSMTENRCVYVPYLGKNDHVADIGKVMLIDGEEGAQRQTIDCLFPKGRAEIDVKDWETVNPFKYEESLPIGLSEETNQYLMERFVYTNLPVINSASVVWRVEEKNIIFY